MDNFPQIEPWFEISARVYLWLNQFDWKNVTPKQRLNKYGIIHVTKTTQLLYINVKLLSATSTVCLCITTLLNNIIALPFTQSQEFLILVIQTKTFKLLPIFNGILAAVALCMYGTLLHCQILDTRIIRTRCRTCVRNRVNTKYIWILMRLPPLEQ